MANESDINSTATSVDTLEERVTPQSVQSLEEPALNTHDFESRNHPSAGGAGSSPKKIQEPVETRRFLYFFKVKKFTSKGGSDNKMRFDSLFPIIGEFGRYQKRIYLLLCLPAICCAMHKLAWVFLGAKLDHR